MNLYSFSVLGFCFGVSLISILTLAKRRDLIGFRFLFFSVSVCGWGYIFAVWVNQNFSLEYTIFLTRLSHAFAVFIPITWLHFVFEFIEKKEPVKYFYFLNYLLASLLALFIPTALFVSGVHSIMEFKYYTSAGPFYHIFAFNFAIIVPYGLYCLIKKWRSSRGPSAVQLKYLTLGAFIGFSSGASTFVPIYHIPFPLWLLAFMPLYPIFTGIALIRYGLFDVNQIVDAFQREKLAAIGTMAASLNHELRNPLYIAKGKIESYLDGAERGLYRSLEEKQQSAEKVLGVAALHLQRAMDIIQRFSDFARPYNDKKDKQRVMLRDLFQDVLELVSHEFEMQKIRLHQEPMDGLSILVNGRQMEEILFNLILNACHAMEDHGGELRLKTFQANGKVVIEVADTGPGIADENQKRIFDPFFSTKEEKGSGLGLYITKQLVEKNGGKISVKSKVGKGTSFFLEFKRS